jgi:putative endonuclease
LAFWCYVLKCADNSYYTGHTEDLERRIAEHSIGGFCAYTSKRRPVELLWASDFPTRHEALECELKVKKWSRAKKEALARSDWQSLAFYARPPAERISTSLDTNG